MSLTKRKSCFIMFVLAYILLVAVGMVVPVRAELQTDNSAGIIAEKVTPSELREGDRLIIVCESNDMALCNKAVPNNNTRLSSGRVETANTATRKVLTDIPDDAAIFQLSETKDGVYLQCDAGYLTSSATGNALFYAQEIEEGSRWQFKDDVFLYNPSAVSTSGSYTYTNYYIEFFSSYFTVYWKRASSSPANFTMSFYRMGNSLPDEPLLQESYYYLPVYDTSDVHGYLANITEDGTVEYLMAYISDRVNAVRGGRNDKVVLLDGGDIYQGTTMSNMTKGHSLSAAYALMEYDAVALGNHEFDWGLENTVDSDGTMPDYNLGEGWQGVNNTPVIISNLYQNGSKVPWGRDYIILEKTAVNADGNEIPVKIGVIGLVGEYGSSILTKEFGDKGYSIRLDFGEVNALAEQLESSGMCDATILLVHDSASTIAAGLTENTVIDLVLGGHTHYNVCEKTAWGLRYIEPSCYSKAYGRVDMAFSADKGVPQFENTANERVYSVPKLTDSGTNADKLDRQIVALTDHVVEMLQVLLNSKVGTITESVLRLTYIEGSGDRSTTCGNWMSSILARAYGADVGIVNGGGLRVEFPVDSNKGERDISVSDVYTMFPFDNKIYLFELTYEDLLTALEYGLSTAGNRLVSEISGITCYYTGEQVNAIVNRDGTVVYRDGVWKDDWRTKTLTVSVNEYIVTTDRTAGNISNPFCTWKDTERLLDSEKIDNVTAIEVLEAEAAISGGYLTIDTSPHFILGEPEDNAEDIDDGADNATLEYLQDYNARKKAFDNFDAARDYTPEALAYVNPTAEKVASYVNDTYNIFKSIYPGNAAALSGGRLGILRKFGLFKQYSGVINDQSAEELKNVPVTIQNVMSEVQNVGLETVNLHCLTSWMNKSAKIFEHDLYIRGVEKFDNAMIAMDVDAEILQRMLAQGAILADKQGINVPTEDCTAEEELEFNSRLVELIVAEENKGGDAGQPFRDFKNYVEELRTNFNEVAGAVAMPEAQNPIVNYDKCWNTYFNFETQGYYLRQAYRYDIAYQLTRAFSLLEICNNIFDTGVSTGNTEYDNYVKAMDALAKMPAGQSPDDIDRSAEATGEGYEGNKKFRVYCPTFNCDITDLSLQWKIVANEVADEQMDEFVNRLHGRSLEEELKLAGLWGTGVVGEWRKWIDDSFMEYSGDRLLWDGKMYDGTWDCPASRSNYCESGHGIGFNGREKDGNIVADIIDPNGTLHKEVWTYRTDTREFITSVFDMPSEMGYTLHVPYIHFTMEPHVE